VLLNNWQHGGDREADAEQHVEGDEELVQLALSMRRGEERPMQTTVMR